jgi:hypothetical protein
MFNFFYKKQLKVKIYKYLDFLPFQGFLIKILNNKNSKFIIKINLKFLIFKLQNFGFFNKIFKIKPILKFYHNSNNYILKKLKLILIQFKNYYLPINNFKKYYKFFKKIIQNSFFKLYILKYKLLSVRTFYKKILKF